MKAFAIVIRDHAISEHGFEVLKKTSEKVGNDFDIERFDAFTPETAHAFTHSYSAPVWTWPWEGTVYDFQIGVKKTSYQTNNPLARVACFLSHYHLWKKAVELNDHVLILEHDAGFIKKFPHEKIKGEMIVSINDPRGATRKSQIYHALVNQQDNPSFTLIPAPWIDEDRTIVQGLPGNSAYIISPRMAKKLLELVDNIGMWPNDALICKQLFPKELFCTTDYYTKIQGLPSTTTR